MNKFCQILRSFSRKINRNLKNSNIDFYALAVWKDKAILQAHYSDEAMNYLQKKGFTFKKAERRDNTFFVDFEKGNLHVTLTKDIRRTK